MGQAPKPGDALKHFHLIQSFDFYEHISTRKVRVRQSFITPTSAHRDIHKRRDQVPLLLDSSLEAEVGGDKRTMRKGDTCIVPAGTPHRFSNHGEVRAVTFNTYSPPEDPPNKKG